MKKYKNIVAYIALLVVFFGSCRKAIDIDVPESERSLVLNCAIEKGKDIEAQVFKSGHVLDNFGYYESENNPYAINDASVYLYENNNEVGQFILSGNGKYLLSNFSPTAGRSYRVEASHADYNPVNGETIFMDSVEVISFDSVRMGKDQDGWEVMFCELKIKDPADVSNYYRLTIFKESYEDMYSLYPQCNDPALEHLGWDDAMYFSDVIFNGDTYAFEVQIDPYSFGYYYGEGDGYVSEDTYSSEAVIYAKLESLSKEMYYYLRSITAQDEAEDFGPFSQPVTVYDNIENGFGIVGSKAVTNVPFNRK